MSNFRSLTPAFAVSPQISLDDVATAAAAGITLVINNRPDGEDPAAPQGAAIAHACAAEGLAYAAIPITHAGFSHAQIDALDHLLADAPGRVLAYCRSGTRSTHLWALARARAGDDPASLIAAAAAAGYDIATLAPMMAALAGER